jgi:hypothetical protein
MRRTGAGRAHRVKRAADAIGRATTIRMLATAALGALTVQFRVQFLDVAAAVIQEMHIDAHSVAGAIELVAGLDWPAGAVRIVILDEVGVEVHSHWL